MANYLRDAIRYQQEMEEANRPATVNSLMARKAAAIKQNAPAENMLTQYAQTMPQNWQQFRQNMAQAYPTPATGASRDQILSAVKQAAVNAGPLMTVFHGSPHMFDAFDASKIGTGEGAQTYGHGLYFAENPSVASSYMGGKSGFISEPLIGGKSIWDLPKELLHNWEMKSGGTSYGMIDELRKVADPTTTLAYYKKSGGALSEIAKEIEKMGVKNSKATSLYKVDLPDNNITKMLDWDKPLSQQSWYRPVADVVKEYKGAGKEVDAYARLISKANARGGEVTGGQLYEGMLSQFGGSQAKVSEFMRDAGIPGIRYLDEGSRAGGQGTSNFVVFPGNEGLLKILERQ